MFLAQQYVKYICFIQLFLKLVFKKEKKEEKCFTVSFIIIQLTLLVLFVFLFMIRITAWVSCFQSEEVLLKADLLAVKSLSFCLSGNEAALAFLFEGWFCCV